MKGFNLTPLCLAAEAGRLHRHFAISWRFLYQPVSVDLVAQVRIVVDNGRILVRLWRCQLLSLHSLYGLIPRRTLSTITFFPSYWSACFSRSSFERHTPTADSPSLTSLSHCQARSAPNAHRRSRNPRRRDISGPNQARGMRREIYRRTCN